MTHPSNREHQARFAARVREQGLVKICEWIPDECRDTFKAIARDMRDAGLPPEQHEPPPDTADKVRQAHRWGWTLDAIAAYAGISAEQVERILEGKS